VKDSGRTTIDLKSSLCVDNPTGSDSYPFSADPTQVNQNTGIERNAESRRSGAGDYLRHGGSAIAGDEERRSATGRRQL